MLIIYGFTLLYDLENGVWTLRDLKADLNAQEPERWNRLRRKNSRLRNQNRNRKPLPIPWCRRC